MEPPLKEVYFPSVRCYFRFWILPCVFHFFFFLWNWWKMCFTPRTRSSSWWTLFSARNRGTLWLRPSAWRVLLALSPTTASMCRSLSALRAQPLCPTASQPCRYKCCFSIWPQYSERFYSVCSNAVLFFFCLTPSSLSLMSCLNLWPRPTCWWNRHTPWPPRASYSAKHLSHLMSMYQWTGFSFISNLN